MKIMDTHGSKFVIDTLLAATNSRKTSPSTTWHQRKYETLDDILDVRTTRFKQFLIDFVNKYKTDDGAVLDMACGSGWDSAILLNQNMRVVGIDMAEDMVKLSRDNKEFFIRHGGERFRNWEIIQGDMRLLKETITSQPYLPQAFDSIFCVGASFSFLMGDNAVRETLQGCFDCLRPGGALMFDSRNFIPVHEKGVINGKGHNPMIKDLKNLGVKDVLPHLVYGPGPEKIAIAVLLQYVNLDGSSTFITMNPMMQDSVEQHVRSVFGKHCNIKVYYDLQAEGECKPDDACWVNYIVEKPLIE